MLREGCVANLAAHRMNRRSNSQIIKPFLTATHLRSVIFLGRLSIEPDLLSELLSNYYFMPSG